ncbi:MAG: Mpo1-like protein [Pseudomonadota bacterium]
MCYQRQVDTNETIFTSFQEFWPFYLSQHQHPQCRLFHFLGTTVAVTLVAVTVLTRSFSWLFLALVLGYGFAWVGHFAFEKNQPATFRYPLYSFVGDWKMFWMMLTGKIKL